jgi:glycosyltransferase involved in cell wall biosynthesis
MDTLLGTYNTTYPFNMPEESSDELETITFKPRKKSIAAVIPAYNEELSIGTVVIKTRKYVDRVIVVDDGSRDQTAEIARTAGAEVIQLRKNQGKAYALMFGFDLVKQLGFSTVVMLDGDGQHDPSAIPNLLKPILSGKADLVIGSRYLEPQNNTPLYRKLGQNALDFLTNFGAEPTEFRATDSQSGFRALNARALKNLDFRADGFGIESAMISHFNTRKLNIFEVPIIPIYDVPNQHKKNPLLHGAEVFQDLLGLIGYRRPLIFFGLSGLAFLVFGIVTGFLAYNVYLATTHVPMLVTILAIFASIMGMLLILVGFLLNAISLFIKMQLK